MGDLTRWELEMWEFTFAGELSSYSGVYVKSGSIEMTTN